MVQALIIDFAQIFETEIIKFSIRFAGIIINCIILYIYYLLVVLRLLCIL